jgi:hypothetical protein
MRDDPASTREPGRFIPGLELSRLFYSEAVLPLLDGAFPGLVYSAVRLGTGSEVLGFDTARSADHEWGPRLQLFLRAQDVGSLAPEISALLAHRLPKSFRGHPTNFASTGEPGIGFMQLTDGPVHHRVDVAEAGAWFTEILGFSPLGGVRLADWLATPTQRLAEVTAGAVFHDGLGVVGKARADLAWYPHDVWLYVLASQWSRVSREEAFVGRCGEVGDELGSAVVAARLVRELMRAVLLMERRYPPYSKWLGSAFAQTRDADVLVPLLTATLGATDWKSRERHLARAYEAIGAIHNSLGLTEPVDESTRPYHGRPFLVLHAERFADALTARITDPSISRLPLIGAVDQHIDSTDLLGRSELAGAAIRAALSQSE